MKLVLTSHGDLCNGLLDSYRMIAGTTNSIFAVPLTDEGISLFSQKLTQLLEQLVLTNDLLILTDIKGGTPYNEAYAFYLAYPKKVRVVSGMNLPMLIETGLNSMQYSLNELVQIAIHAGKSGVEIAEKATESQENDIVF